MTAVGGPVAQRDLDGFALAPFTLAGFLRDRWGVIAAGVACALIVGGMTHVLGATIHGSLACAGVVLLFLMAGLAASYIPRRRFYADLAEASSGLGRAYYLQETAPEAHFLEGRILLDVCGEVCRRDAEDLSQERARAEANRRFVDLWTHEVKTPIAASRLTLARMHGPDAFALKQDLDRIEQACERALFASKVSTLNADYAIGSHSLAGLCQEACKSLSSLMISSGLTPVFDLEPQVKVMTDPAWTCFVLRQVISNSAKYGATSLRFSCRCQDLDSPRGRVTLAVADNGVGIPESEVPQVFDLGFSGSNGRQEGKSTGMGLYLASEVCKAMGVALAVSSEEGRGTTVELAFPFNVEASRPVR